MNTNSNELPVLTGACGKTESACDPHFDCGYCDYTNQGEKPNCFDQQKDKVQQVSSQQRLPNPCEYCPADTMVCKICPNGQGRV